jgi:hypothetical protein
MTQPDYKFYKKKILKYLDTNYVIAKRKSYVYKKNDPFHKLYIKTSAKYRIFTKEDNQEVSASILLDGIKQIFDIDDTTTIKKILKYWSKNRLTKRNWLKWEMELPSGTLFYMDYVYQQPPQIQLGNWDHNVDFNPRVSVSSRYAKVKVNERYYSRFDVARPDEESHQIDVKIKPITPVQRIDLNITINNEQT